MVAFGGDVLSRGRRRCHFLHPRRGLLVIEVKDWKLENIRSMDRLTATLQADGREVRKSNPLEQAKQYAFGVCRLPESDPALVGEPGASYQGKLAFPWGYGVVLANISRKAFAGTDPGNVIPPERVEKSRDRPLFPKAEIVVCPLARCRPRGQPSCSCSVDPMQRVAAIQCRRPAGRD